MRALPPGPSGHRQLQRTLFSLQGRAVLRSPTGDGVNQFPLNFSLSPIPIPSPLLTSSQDVLRGITSVLTVLRDLVDQSVALLPVQAIAARSPPPPPPALTGVESPWPLERRMARMCEEGRTGLEAFGSTHAAAAGVIKKVGSEMPLWVLRHPEHDLRGRG